MNRIALMKMNNPEPNNNPFPSTNEDYYDDPFGVELPELDYNDNTEAD